MMQTMKNRNAVVQTLTMSDEDVAMQSCNNAFLVLVFLHLKITVDDDHFYLKLTLTLAGDIHDYVTTAVFDCCRGSKVTTAGGGEPSADKRGLDSERAGGRRSGGPARCALSATRGAFSLLTT